MCDACDYRWIPCSDQYCRGYRVVTENAPGIIGCPDCDKEHGGVRSSVVQWWPEAWRAVARKLDDREDKNALVPKTSSVPARE